MSPAVSTWLLDRLHEEFSALADRCSARELAGEVARVATRLAEELPGRAAEVFLQAKAGKQEGEA